MKKLFVALVALPLFLSAESLLTHDEMRQLLVERGYSLDETEHPVVHCAIEQGDLEGVQWAVELGYAANQKGLDGVGSLHKAAQGGHRDICAYLLETGCLIDEQTDEGLSSYHMAMRAGHFSLLSLFVEYGFQPLGWIDDFCLCHQIDPDSKDKKGTLLHKAVAEGPLETVQALLARGDPVDTVDEYGTTPLMLAVMRTRPDVVQEVMCAGGEVNIQDEKGHTALHYAVQLRLRALVALLLQHHELHINVYDKRGVTPLHYACALGDLKLVKQLLEADAWVNAATEPPFWTSDEIEGPLYPRVTPLAIVQEMHAQHTALLALLEEWGAKAEHIPSIRNICLNQYLKS